MLKHWFNLSLARQFAGASFVILAIGMTGVASWVTSQIEKGVVSNSALSGALFMDSFIAPLIQELNTTTEISLENQTALDALIEQTPLGEQVESFKIWGIDGLVLYSSNDKLIGLRFPVTETQKRAWSGEIQAEYDNLEDEEDIHERSLNLPLIEIYSPIRNKSGSIIAVSEFYSNAGKLKSDLFNANLQSWLLFFAVGLFMFAALSGIALRGSRTIENQQLTLNNRVNELSILRNRLEAASRRATEHNEHFLRKVGSELHDGPAQLLALALLKLEDLFKSNRHGKSQHKLAESIKEPLRDALSEIRNLSNGLVLPELEDKSLREVVLRAVESHRRRTCAKVSLHHHVDHELSNLRYSTAICIYRLIQEALNNSLQHGETNNSEVTVILEKNTLSISISDQGVGFNKSLIKSESDGLGLPGLRERIESVGGEFDLHSSPGAGTLVEARFNLSEEVS